MAEEQVSEEVTETEDPLVAEPEAEPVVKAEEESAEVEDPIKADDDAEASDANDESGSEQEGSTGAPEEYEAFNVPEGSEINEGMMAAFTEEAKTDGLTQKQAQDRMDMLMRWKDVADKQASEYWVQLGKEWRDRAREEGLLKQDRILMSNAGIKSVDPGGELTKILVSCQLHEHPAMLKLFEHYGKSVSPPTDVPQTSGDAAKVLDRRAILYPDMMKES